MGAGFLCYGLLLFGTAVVAADDTIRRWDEERVLFWRDIYTKYNSTQSVVHDNQYPHVIYEVIDFTSATLPGKTGNDIDQRSAIIAGTIAKYQEILQRFDMGSAAFYQQSEDERRVYNLFKPINDSDKFRNASSRDRIRVQDGRADSFKEAIKRSSRYLSGMQTILRSYGMPEQLVSLVFVESLFYLQAVSKVGAAGPWQLMPATAKRFIKVGDDVDERFDPFISTMAAAQVLKENYEKLDRSWPLALTAYNHGLGGMLRAKKEFGGSNLEEIIRNYKSDSFKFASKNFYAQYLAAADAFTNRNRYFGHIVFDKPLEYDRILVPYAIPFDKLVAAVGADAGSIMDLNPALTSLVTSNRLPVPINYPLRTPVGKGTLAIQTLREQEPKHKKQSAKNYNATALPIMLDDLGK